MISLIIVGLINYFLTPSGTLAYRVVQFTPDGGVDSLPQGTVPGTVTSLLASPQANGSPAESPETRLALITQGDVSSDGKRGIYY